MEAGGPATRPLVGHCGGHAAAADDDRRMARVMRRDIVVVGASMGGVEALQMLAAGLPSDLPASVFVVLHVSPDAPSMLHEILGRSGPLPAEPARDGAPILPGRIYSAVPDRHLLLEDACMRLTRAPRENCVRPAVDVLFRSAALAFGPRVVGAVLTGNLDDGTAGLWAVKARGGVALVQSPAEAPAPSMPRSALEHVEVDSILSMTDMAQAIAGYCRAPIAIPEAAAVPPAMPIEVALAIGATVSERTTVPVGELSPYACPECHGVMREIREGSIVRYRCHTGHASSQLTLLAQADEAIDTSLWNALRAIEERIVLLRRMEAQAADPGHAARAGEYAATLRVSEAWARHLRDMLLHPTLRGSYPLSPLGEGAQR